MICDSLFTKLGFSWRVRPDGSYRVCTPFTFTDGEPIGLYLSSRHGLARISDNADTLFHMRSIGLDVSDRRKWRGMGSIVSAFGLTLHDSGEVFGEAEEGGEHTLLASYLGAMLAIAEMEREALCLSPEPETFVDEVGGYLNVWRPNDILLRNVSVRGHSGRSHTFHFMLGPDLIDAARPNSTRTGAILRKVADIRNGPGAGEITVVMDDRGDQERASAESDILGTLVRVLPMSRLIRNLSGAGDPDAALRH